MPETVEGDRNSSGCQKTVVGAGNGSGCQER